MAVTIISRQQYSDYVTDFVAYTGEQWLDNGIPLTFTLERDDDVYYLTVEIQFGIEETESIRKEIEEAKEFVERFGCRMCDTLEEVNEQIKGILPDYCLFQMDEHENIWGW